MAPAQVWLILTILLASEISQSAATFASQWVNPQLAKKEELFPEARFLNISYLTFNTTTAALISGAVLFLLLNTAFIC